VSGQDTTTYPHLGYNPVPGVPQEVEAMGARLGQAADSLQQAGSLWDRMRDATGGVWQGDAGDAFREHLNGDLSASLRHAHSSLDLAVGVLTNWYGDLVGFKDAAARLDREAADARQAAQRADDALAQARGDPDLALAGEYFDTPEALRAAQSRIDAAESAVREAENAARNAREQLEAVMRRAHELAAEHESAAARYANELRHATDGLAPHKPAFFSGVMNDFAKGLSTVGDWAESHVAAVHAALSTVSALAGLVALCTPPPIDAVAGAVAIGAGTGALACDLANPTVRDAVGGLLAGHFTAQNLSNASDLGRDALGAIPGGRLVGSALKEGRVALNVGRTAEDGSRAVDVALSIPSLASKIPGLARLGGDAAAAFADAADNAGNLVTAGSNLAHSPSLPVRLGVAIADRLLNAGSTGADVTHMPRELVQNLELGWKAKSVVNSLYSDVQQAAS
jgi:hypothetical protein